MMRLQKQPAGTNPTGCNRFTPQACQSVSSPQSSVSVGAWRMARQMQQPVTARSVK
ncbi:hypothetical protein QVO10_10130 [Bacteroides gallinaceum]|uniref:Uncharacterized protein n=3 Tax=Bacteroidaceae TaxID=815 RepID=A0ABT7X6M9_9BACE|nr:MULTISPECIES: hypothetical protein [Bacteroidaceae]MBD8039391.1 hypothetical protein [Phocaeicola intestinalis]MBM6718954.1 hypothetical protein [Bacteroides gallinaceum]MBM6735121.1 hypothetical protein [Mediterranea massiliensis]MBM6890864.1 hypothetical protein [Bacteroides caecigallinarum]MBM6904416.1 hypothetical protein [Phocaeicola coprocola]